VLEKMQRLIILSTVVGIALIAGAHGEDLEDMDRLTERALQMWQLPTEAADLEDTMLGKGEEAVASKAAIQQKATPKYKPPINKPSLYSQGVTGPPVGIPPLGRNAFGAGNYKPPKAQPSLYSQGVMGKGKNGISGYEAPEAKPTLYSQGITGPYYKYGLKDKYIPPKTSKGYDLDNLPQKPTQPYFGVTTVRAKENLLPKITNSEPAQVRPGDRPDDEAQGDVDKVAEAEAWITAFKARSQAQAA
jgi:hypothetical protein